MPFSKEVYIEREDFIEEKPNKKWKRLALGVEVRLMHAYFVKANSVVKDENGKIIEVHCTYDKETKSGSGFTDRKPNGNIHFVDASRNKKATFRIFDDLITDFEDKDTPFVDKVNPNSLVELEGFVEESVDPKVGDSYQFVRNGYYSLENHLIFNQTVSLRSSFKK